MIDGVFLLLGSNLGDKKYNLATAREHIKAAIGEIITSSSIYETAAWGKTNQPAFLNQVIQVKTSVTPEQLLQKINHIESEMGRIRVEKWGERLIDIDILYYNHEVVQTEKLHIPHPGIPERRFTLMPLTEIAPDFIHPVLQKSNVSLLQLCEDSLEVKPLN